MTDVPQNPGTLLRQQRQLLGLSPAEVAQQLNLKPIVIEQLEQLAFDGTVAPTFLRGYLKLYARLLKLNEQQILQQFEPHLQTLSAPLAMHSFSHKTRRDAAENRFMLASYFLAVLLIGLSIVWFWQTHLIDNEPVLSVNTVADANALTGRKQTFSKPSAPPAAAVPAESAGTAEPAAGTTITASSADGSQQTALNPATASALVPADAAPQVVTDDVATDDVATDDTAAATAESAPGVGAPASTAALQDVTTSAPAPAAPTAETAATSSETAVAAPAAQATAQPNTAIADVTAAAEAGAVELQFTFQAQCWLEVTGADGKRLAYQMAAAGQQLQLSGVSPVKVVLGNPTAVQLVRNGQPVDLSSYQPGRAARLTLTGSN